MRKSSAPSLRGRASGSGTASFISSPTVIITDILPKRSTENILELITSGDSLLEAPRTLSEPLRQTKATPEDSLHNVITPFAEEKLKSCEPSPMIREHERIFAIMYAKPSSKKHKTWEGDGFLYVYEKYCLAKDDNDKKIGTLKISKAKPVEEGSHLFIGDKEILVSEEVSAEQARSHSASLPTKVVTKENVAPQPPRPAIQAHKSVDVAEIISSVSNEVESDHRILAGVMYSILHAKPSTRKHKVWEGDGTLLMGNKTATAKDENGKIIGTIKLSNSLKLEEGTRIKVGSKEIELVEKISAEDLKRKAETDLSASMPDTKKLKPLLVNKVFINPRLGSVQKNLNIHLDNDAFVLSDPPDDHQWHFRSGAPLTPVAVEPFLARKLRQHQKKGITFLYECIMGFKDIGISGAILADEMGLGKTLQCIALIWTLLRQGPYGKPTAQQVLIVTPSSLTGNWAAEFRKWLGDSRMIPYVIDGKHKPGDRSPHQRVVIVSYEMLLRHTEAIGGTFDLLICDEAHRLKNSETKVSQALNELCISRRILLTGTPIQNDLQEFYALVDFCNPNSVGNYSSFRKQYEEPILAARQPDAEAEVRELGEERATELSQLTGVFVLRRTQSVLEAYLPGKKECVVFCKPSPLQQFVYNSVLESLDLGCGLGGDGASHLGVISSLRKVANHPALLKKEDPESPVSLESIRHKSEEDASMEDSGKLMVVLGLLSELWSSSPRERIVIVSSFTQTLDMLQEVCQMQDYPILRLDGSTPSTQRTDTVSRFNNDASQFVFLLSAKAGGVGLNLVGASRLVLYDSDWNPATDLQAMGRIWRDGQRREVFIYRLLTTGTIEEKIFQRQLSKQTLAGGIVDSLSGTSVLLSKDELKEIFVPCEEVESCWTHASLACQCAADGTVPVPLLNKESRACHVEVAGAQTSALRIEELMSWEHHGAPLSHQLLSTLKLSQCQDIITFMFSTNC